jgi:hypothetical protein
MVERMQSTFSKVFYVPKCPTQLIMEDDTGIDEEHGNLNIENKLAYNFVS